MESNIEFTEEEFWERMSMFATEDTIKRHLPKRTRKVSSGLCPCCGKPCAPFTTCKEYREKQALGHFLRGEIAAGRVKVIGRKGRELIYQKTEEGAAYYREQAAGRQHVRHQGSKERQRNLKRLQVLR